MTLEALRARYLSCAHAVQSGIAFMMDRTPYYNPTTPKHMRTGIDLGKAEFGAVCQLLIDKGVISEQELWEALVKGVEQEKVSYEKLCTEAAGGIEVTLG